MSSKRYHLNFVFLAVTGAVLLLTALVSAAQSTNGLDFTFFQIIGQRNIFDPNRVPHRRATASSARVVDSFSFVGTMSYAKGTFAFFDGTSRDFRKVLERDGTIADFKITAINPRSVTLLAGTNETVLPLGTRMYRDDNGQWVVSAESASYASTAGSSAANRRSLNHQRFHDVPAGSAAATDDLQTEGSSTSAPAGVTEMGTDVGARPAPPVSGGANDALTRLMQRRAQEEQQLGQGQ